MTLTLPSLLSFERKLETSDGLMFSGLWKSERNLKNNWLPIEVIPRKNLSTQSAYGTSLENMKKPNPVAAENDDANLPSHHDTLRLTFSLRIIGNLGKPFACKDPKFHKAITQKVAEFKQTDAMKNLAFRYAYNIANGRFLWRNRVCAESVEIQTEISNGTQQKFNAYDFDLNGFEKNKDNSVLQQLAQAVLEGLVSEDKFVLITVDAFVKLGLGQHVFPSQEMNVGEKKKILFKINNKAAMHNVKIGNALRTVDNWYSNAQFPIAAEPFGSVVQIHEAFRPSKCDLYTLMQAWVNSKDIKTEDQAYIVANLIRGGVFSGESQNKKVDKKKGELSESDNVGD